MAGGDRSQSASPLGILRRMQPWPEFEVLIDADKIRARIGELARDLRDAFAPLEEPPLLVGVWEGAKPFARDLERALGFGQPVHGIRASSYGAGTVSSGTVAVRGLEDLPLAERHVLLIEDIVDTGRTIEVLKARFTERGALSVRVAALLDKPSRRVPEGGAAEHVGFSIPDEFVIGYGMDVAGRFRELPHVAVYDPTRDPQR
jgi:hypoxanthine phosphoribosyltransferase